MTAAKLMNVRTGGALLLAVASLMLLGGFAQAQTVLMIPASEAAGPPAASAPGDGLNGSWFSDPANPAQVYNNIAGAINYMGALPPEGTFTATLLFWNGSDTTDINAFLDSTFGHDAKTLNPPVMQGLHSSIFDMTGFLNITSADLTTTFALNSDDGSAFYIGMPGTYDYTVILDDGTHGAVQVNQVVQFEAPGLYPIEIIYFNQDYSGSTGGAIFNFLSTLDNGGIVNGSRLYTKVTP